MISKTTFFYVLFGLALMPAANANSVSGEISCEIPAGTADAFGQNPQSSTPWGINYGQLLIDHQNAQLTVVIKNGEGVLTLDDGQGVKEEHVLTAQSQTRCSSYQVFQCHTSVDLSYSDDPHVGLIHSVNLPGQLEDGVQIIEPTSVQETVMNAGVRGNFENLLRQFSDSPVVELSFSCEGQIQEN